jgi:hypothetical protein
MLISVVALGSALHASAAVGAPGPAFQQVANLAVPSKTGGALSENDVALSADGNTALIGGPNDDGGNGAAWFFVRSGSKWVEQGKKLPGREAGTSFGFSVALSADGNTALIGDPDAGFDDIGAVSIFTRSGSTWTQQGPTLTRRGASGQGGQFGTSVALSADGNTAVIGAPDSGNNDGPGAVWVFTRSGSTWAQEGKLSGRGGSGTGFGTGVALSGDGSTTLVAGPDRVIGTVAWVFARSGSTWTQQGKALNIGDGTSDGVALSGDGNTALIGTAGSSAARVFTRSGSTWAQQETLTGHGEVADLTVSVALSKDGDTALVGDEGSGNAGYAGAAWVFARSGSTWTQEGGSLTGKGGTRNPSFGYSVALAGDGKTALIGGNNSKNLAEAWVFQRR